MAVRQGRELDEPSGLADPPHLGRASPPRSPRPPISMIDVTRASAPIVVGLVADEVDVDDEVDGLCDQAPHRELGQARVRLRHVVGESL